jgi:predicted alpha/beta-fold hydrolase
MRSLQLYDHSRPGWSRVGPRPVPVQVWRPTRRDGPPPTVLVSHGSGGAAVQMAWLSEPLTSAGFLVVAFDHHGNSFVDGHLAEGFARWWERPLDLAFALDRLAERIVLGPVGAAGFSLGGYSAAALLGARVDADLYAALLSGALRVPPPPEYPELEQELRARLSEDDIAAWVADAGRNYSDGRAQAAPNGSAPTHTPHLRLAGTLRRFDSCPANPAGAKGGQPEMGSLRLVRCPAESGRGRDCGTRRPASSLHPGPLGTTPV